MSTEILCIVEIPKGSRDRFPSSSVVIPTDYGFVPETLGPDGENPLDVMVAVSEPTLTGSGVVARPVAVLQLSDQGELEHKVLCVPSEDPNWQHVAGLDDLPDQLLEEVARFFVADRRREGRAVKVAGWSSRGDAARVIREAQDRFRQNHPPDDDS